MSTAITISDADAAGLGLGSTPAGAPTPGAWGDVVGMTASIGCAIHCAAMPFVIAYLPALGLSFLADEAFHQWMAVGCFVIALVAFIPGLRNHGRWTPVGVGSVGLAMISVAAFGFAGECCPSCAPSETAVASASEAACTDAGCIHCESEHAPTPTTGSDAVAGVSPIETRAESSWIGQFAPLLTPIGGIVLVSAHLLNRRYGSECGCCRGGSCEAAG